MASFTMILMQTIPRLPSLILMVRNRLVMGLTSRLFGTPAVSSPSLLPDK
jgi:hypothetical protein